jgi:hypothetical protein
MFMRSRAFGELAFGVALLLLGCHRAPERGKPAPSSSAGARTEQVAPPSSALSAPSGAPFAMSAAPAAENAPIVRAVQAWNDALDRHDLVALEKLYADSIAFYGREQSRLSVIRAKRGAFAKQPDFHQQLIGSVDVHAEPGGTFSAYFLKRTDGGGKTLVIGALLRLARAADGSLRVTQETDVETERKKPSDVVSSCVETAAEAVNSLPQIKQAIAGAQKAADESGGSARFGGIGPTEDSDGVSASIGIHTDERFETYATYSVDAAGHLVVTAGGDDVPVPASLLRKVANACRH